jgi:flagellar assembly protein FliH
MAGQTRLLKANATRELGSNVVFNYDNLHQQCDDYLKRINQQAATIITDANAQAEQIRAAALKDATQKGFSQGIENADEHIKKQTEENTRTQVGSQIQTIIPSVENVARLLENEKEKWISDWEGSVINLVLLIAEKIVRTKLDLNPELSQEMIRGALELAAGQRHITVTMNPVDVEILGDKSEEVVSVLAGCGQAEIRTDESISPGGCVIESRQGTIDARLETQIERIAAELLARNE